MNRTLTSALLCLTMGTPSSAVFASAPTPVPPCKTRAGKSRATEPSRHSR